MRSDLQGSIKSAFVRARNLLIRPQAEWQAIKGEPAGYKTGLVGYVAILALLPPLSAVIGNVIFDRNIVNRSLHYPLGYVLAANLLWYGMILLNVAIAGAIVTAVATRDDPGWLGLRGLKIAAYSFTPLFVAGVAIVIPGLDWLIYPAILYSVYILALGIITLIGTKPAKAAWHAFISFVAAGFILGMLNLFEYMFESYVAKIFIFSS